MKSYSVKSNAKRFARGIAAKHPENIEAIEPVETAEGEREWYPAIKVTGDVTDGFRAMVFDSYGDVAMIEGFPTGGPFAAGDRVLAQGFAGTVDEVDGDEVVVTFDVSGCAGDVPAKDLAIVPDGLRPYQREMVDSILSGGASAAKDITAADMARVAATLPPPVKSSREEIDARREERRQRIDAEKAAGTRNESGAKVKINKTNVILDLVKRPNGATQTELETATGWQRHTLRGYIAGTLRKRLAPVGKDIECRRAKGEETRYVLVAKKGGEA